MSEKITLKEAIDKARESQHPQVPKHPVQFDGEVERSTTVNPAFAAPYGNGRAITEADAVKYMVDAMPLLALADSYLRPRPDGFLEVKDGAVGLVDEPTRFTAPTHDGSPHHYIENYGGTVANGFKAPPGVEPLFAEPWTGTGTIADAITEYEKRKASAMADLAKEIPTRPVRVEDITAEMLDASPFLLRNMVEANGKTIKQNNMERGHAIPIDALVELDNGVRLFVTKHTRDCDGTPMYSLAEYQTTSEEGTPLYLSTGHVEDCLTVVDTAADAKEEHY